MIVIPGNISCTIKSVTRQGISVQYGIAGDNVEFGLAGIEENNVW